MRIIIIDIIINIDIIIIGIIIIGMVTTDIIITGIIIIDMITTGIIIIGTIIEKITSMDTVTDMQTDMAIPIIIDFEYELKTMLYSFVLQNVMECNNNLVQLTIEFST